MEAEEGDWVGNESGGAGLLYDRGGGGRYCASTDLRGDHDH